MSKKNFERRAPVYFSGVLIGIILALFLLKGRNSRIPKFEETPENTVPRLFLKRGGKVSFTLSPNLMKFMLPDSTNFLVLGKKESETKWTIQKKLDLPLPKKEAPSFREFSGTGDYEIRGIFSLCEIMREGEMPEHCKRSRIVYPITVNETDSREQLDVYVDM